ncbi:MAG: PrgI family protein [Candidatus Saccharimonadales bacterium]
MSTYKVIQDIEAEDKLVGPLTLRQFIYGCISAFCLYLSYLSYTKHVSVMLIIFLPIAGFTGFFAFPWGKDQPTELWALAKVRFMIKPRKRIWDQSGIKELVTITAPKRIQRVYTDGLSQTEVRSRLQALASTIDSRGWVIKNMNINLNSSGVQLPQLASDRLVEASSLPQEVSGVDVNAADDILDANANPLAHQFDNMINSSYQAHRQQIINQLQQPATNQTQDTTQPNSAQASQPNDYWFLNQPAPAPAGTSTFSAGPIVSPGTVNEPAGVPQAATPTDEETALVDKLKEANRESHEIIYGNTKVVMPLSAQAATTPTPTQPGPVPATTEPVIRTPSPVTAQDTAAIMNLASNDDLDIATIARQAKHRQGDDGDEVVISLH